MTSTIEIFGALDSCAGLGLTRKFCFLFYYFFFETGWPQIGYVVDGDLELIIFLPPPGITDVCHNIWLSWCWGLSPELWTC